MRLPQLRFDLKDGFSHLSSCVFFANTSREKLSFLSVRQPEAEAPALFIAPSPAGPLSPSFTVLRVRACACASPPRPREWRGGERKRSRHRPHAAEAKKSIAKSAIDKACLICVENTIYLDRFVERSPKEKRRYGKFLSVPSKAQAPTTHTHRRPDPVCLQTWRRRGQGGGAPTRASPCAQIQPRMRLSGDSMEGLKKYPLSLLAYARQVA